MPKIICCLALCLTLAGCPTVDGLTLSAGEAQLLTENTESTLEIQQLFTKFAFGAARGDLVSLVGLTYDPPTAQNNWTGNLSVSNGVFPFGVGDLNLTFNVSGDAGLTDPYSLGVDLSDDAQVDVDVVATFLGMQDGAPVDLSTTFSATTLQNAVNDVTTRVNGVFAIDYDGYVADIQAVDLDLTIDLVTDEITSVLGSVTANIDIPNFALDANVVLTGLGDSVQIGLDIAGTFIDYVLNLGGLLP